VGGDEWYAEHVEEIIAEKTPIEYEVPMPDYSMEGMGKPGEIVAIVAGTLLVLVISSGVGKVLGKKRDFLLFTGTIQKTAESAEARREKQHISAPLCVLCGESFLPRSIYPE